MKTALGAFTALLIAGAYMRSQPMPKCRYGRHQDFLFRSARERLYPRNRETNGASVKDITAPDRRRGGKSDGGRSVGRANAVIGS